ncbi:MAG: hypothetical protein MUE40_05060 [Anaerolineae bacterium]|jgi:hypothetical protein|nr:hypothetical protein [Anaerolineae bacterium]
MRSYTELPDGDPLRQETAPGPDFIRKPHLKPRLYQETLLEILAAGADDVAANRNGILTRTQRDTLLKTLNSDTDAMRLLLTIFLGVSLLLAFIFLGQGLDMSGLVLGAGGMIGAMTLVWWRRQNRLRDDLQVRVERVEGVPRLHELGRLETVRNYGLVLQHLYIPLSRQAYEQLQQYELPTVRAYITARSRTLLSLEVLTGYDDDGAKLKNDLLLPADDEKRKNDLLLPETDEADEKRKNDALPVADSTPDRQQR